MADDQTREARQCPDDGTCHHDCANTGGGRHCWRVHNACPLLAAGFPNDEWPEFPFAVKCCCAVGAALSVDSDPTMRPYEGGCTICDERNAEMWRDDPSAPAPPCEHVREQPDYRAAIIEARDAPAEPRADDLFAQGWLAAVNAIEKGASER